MIVAVGILYVLIIASFIFIMKTMADVESELKSKIAQLDRQGERFEGIIRDHQNRIWQLENPAKFKIGDEVSYKIPSWGTGGGRTIKGIILTQRAKDDGNRYDLFSKEESYTYKDVAEHCLTPAN